MLFAIEAFHFFQNTKFVILKRSRPAVFPVNERLVMISQFPLIPLCKCRVTSRAFAMKLLFRYTIVSLLLFAPASELMAQVRHTISGYLKDAKSGENLISATVRVKEKPDQGAVTNEYGFYSLTLPDGNYTLIASSLGYANKELSISLNKDLKQNITMDAEGKQLSEVQVTARAKDENVRGAQMGMERINMKEANLVPVLFGERDILKTVQYLPGVKSAGEGNSGFFVRGGSADQNLILLDEALVYNPSHLLGFFSTFNSDAIKDATLYKGNMPAQYGGRLSSAMDIKMKDGNDQSYHVNGGIGLISSRLSVEGPIVKDKGSFLVSARRTYADIFLKLSPDSTINRNQLYFYDLNLKASYKLGENDRVFLSGYFGQDKLGLADLFGFTWGNSTGTLRWNHVFGPRFFSNSSIIYNDYRYDINLTVNTVTGAIQSRIRDWNIKEELSFFPNNKNSMRAGLNVIHHSILPGQYSGDFTVPNIPEAESWEEAAFVQNSWKATEKLNIDYGIRISAFQAMGGAAPYYNLDESGNIIDTMHYGAGQVAKAYVIPEPRISASYRLNEKSSIKAAYSRNAQYLHLLSTSASSNPTDKWVPSNNVIKPEIADQVSIGYFRNFADNKFEFSAETYYKQMQNQIDYKDGANVLSNEPLEPQLLFGVGRAYGLELLLRKRAGKFTGWISYTLSRSERQIDGINHDQWYAARQDRTHDISLVGLYQYNERLNFSATFVYYTGNAVSFPAGKYEVDNRVIYYYTERNGYRMPSYNRLDLSATYQFKPKKNFSSELAFGLYNAYGRQNAYAITFRQDPDDASRTQAVQTALFRWVPSITYNFKF
jgi:hypothetical protein